MVKATGLRVETSHLLLLTGGISVLLAGQTFYTFYRSEPLIADMLGILAVNTFTPCMIGVLALAGLAINAPLIDEVLIQVDKNLGLDAGLFVEMISLLPILHSSLYFSYQFSVVMLIFVPLILAALRRAEAAWRFCTMIVLSGLTCALLSIPFPAAGAFSGLHISDKIIARLPEGAGLYYMATFDAYRSGLLKTIRLDELNGVVTFPSFHAAFACVTAHALMPFRYLRLPVMLWTTMVMASTIVMGGHYFIDVFAGMALFAVAAFITRPQRASPMIPVDRARSERPAGFSGPGR
jgi:membrane-associated phospholipid phosphatase